MPKPLFPPAAHPFVYIPDGALDVWRTARDASATAPAWIDFVGDSYTHGINSTDITTKSWVALVRAQLLGRGFPLMGDFYHITQSDQYNIYYTGTPPFTINTTGSTSPFSYYWGRVWYYPATGALSNTPIVFTSPYACTDMDIYWWDTNASSGTWTYNVDGGSTQTVTNTGANKIQKTSISGLANTTHVINFLGQSGNYNLFIMGVATYSSRTHGIGFCRLATSGTAFWNLTTNDGVPADRMQIYSGNNNGTPNFGFPMQPHLATIAYGINDTTLYSIRFGPQGFKDGLRRMIESYRRGRDNCSILLIINPDMDPDSSDEASGALFGNTGNGYTLTCDAYYQAARDYNCALVNLNARWGEDPVGQGFLPSGGQHPTDVGYADMAAAISQVILS